MTVGFIGLGKMGGPMAANVARATPDLVCFDLAGTHDRMPAGTAAAQSIADLARRCTTVLISVPDGAASLAVAKALVAAESPTVNTVIDLSTVGPAAAAEAAALLDAAGITYCDGPVSGGAAGARAATISLMFSGPVEVLEEHRALLDSFTGNVFHVGDRAGQGQAMKLANNFLSATALAATSEAIAFGQSVGLDMATMLEVLNSASGQSAATADKFPNHVLTGRYASGFTNSLMAKDVQLYLRAVEERGGPSSLGALTASLWEKFAAAEPGVDFTRIYPFVADGGHTRPDVPRD